MPIVERSLEVPYTPAEMYELVDQVEAYEKFLPWCTESTVLNRDNEEVHARLTLTGGGFSKSFTTRNRLQKNKMITIRLVQGPFNNLEGFWSFQTSSKKAHSLIILHLEFEFSNKLLAFAFGRVFQRIANNLVDAFVQRAQELYGRR